MNQPTGTRRGRVPIPVWIGGVLVIAMMAVVAWARVGLLDLPGVPRGLTLESAGLVGLEDLQRLDRHVRGDGTASGEAWYGESRKPDDALARAVRDVKEGWDATHRDDVAAGLERMRHGIEQAPDNLVLGNAYRMVVFKLRREFLWAAKQSGSLTPEFPPHLHRQPIAFFEQLVQQHPRRESKLQLSLAWVDEMLLFPALEIKAPASVEAVNILSAMLDGGDSAYVPALFARGLNHLHRPARLVWPESRKTPADAAVRDVAKCVAIGRKLGVGSARLQATLALTLGDAYVKAGRFDNARSWWQIAQNLCRDDDVQQSVRRRYGWPDKDIVDRLEEELDRSRSELDHPMTDLALMWN